MSSQPEAVAYTYTAFAGEQLIVTADLITMLRRTKEYLDGGQGAPVLIFEDQTGAQLDFDFRGSFDEVVARLVSHPRFAASDAAPHASPDASPDAAPDAAPRPRPGPGRPKLGVVSREVSLLPRHWAWLEAQPGGISSTLRKLVEGAARCRRGADLARRAWESAGRFMWVMAGNLPGFEEASRALFAKDRGRLAGLVQDWPADLRRHLERLVEEAARLDAEAVSQQASTVRP